LADARGAQICVRKNGVRVVFGVFWDLQRQDPRARHVSLRARCLSLAATALDAAMMYVPAAIESFVASGTIELLLEFISALPECTTTQPFAVGLTNRLLYGL
jgi:hypothetical protein